MDNINNSVNNSTTTSINDNPNINKPTTQGAFNNKKVTILGRIKSFFSNLIKILFGESTSKNIQDRDIKTASPIERNPESTKTTNFDDHIYENIPFNATKAKPNIAKKSLTDTQTPSVRPKPKPRTKLLEQTNTSAGSKPNTTLITPHRLEPGIYEDYDPEGIYSDVESWHFEEKAQQYAKRPVAKPRTKLSEETNTSAGSKPNTTLRTPHRLEPGVYENYDPEKAQQHNEPIYGNLREDGSINMETAQDVNMSAINNQQNSGLSQDSQQAVSKGMETMRSFLSEQQFMNIEASATTDAIFNNEIRVIKSQFDQTIKADNKYNDISCLTHSSATKGNIYHANKMDLPHGNYIASQGPYMNSVKAQRKGNSASTMDNFIAMLAENQSPISVSLVNTGEFANSINNKIPLNKGETYEIPEQKSGNQTIREKTVIEKLDEITYNDLGFQVDTFAINGKTHIRVYDLQWPDKTAGDPNRLVALALFTEKLRQLPELADRKDNRITINCNAGVGRTGTFMMIHDAVVQYQQDGSMPKMNDVTQTIIQARQNRPHMVQKSSQLESINIAINTPREVLDNLANSFNS